MHFHVMLLTRSFDGPFPISSHKFVYVCVHVYSPKCAFVCVFASVFIVNVYDSL